MQFYARKASSPGNEKALVTFLNDTPDVATQVWTYGTGWATYSSGIPISSQRLNQAVTSSYQLYEVSDEVVVPANGKLYLYLWSSGTTEVLVDFDNIELNLETNPVPNYLENETDCDSTMKAAYFQTKTSPTANSSGTVTLVAKDANTGTANAGWLPMKKV